jgi:hypothetical protein
MNNSSGTRREFVRKAAYVAPAILTFAAAPAFAKSGSEKADWRGHDDDHGDDRGNDRGDDHDDRRNKPPKKHGWEPPRHGRGDD